MGKIVVKIVADGTNVSGGLVDFEMLRLYKADVVRLTTDIAESQVSGGVLPLTQAEYDAIVA
jgi:hypothetical protein